MLQEFEFQRSLPGVQIVASLQEGLENLRVLKSDQALSKRAYEVTKKILQNAHTLSEGKKFFSYLSDLFLIRR